MREYETTFIIQPELSEEGVQAVCGRIEAILEKQGATRLFYDDMGRRRLAYVIRNFQKGHYLTIFYLDDGKVVAELERALRLDDSVLRYLTVLGNPEVADIDARQAEGVELERARAERAAERAAREAEEAAREAAEREAAGQAQAEAAAEEPGTAPDAAPASSPEGAEAEPAAAEESGTAPDAAASPAAAEAETAGDGEATPSEPDASDAPAPAEDPGSTEAAEEAQEAEK